MAAPRKSEEFVLEMDTSLEGRLYGENILLGVDELKKEISKVARLNKIASCVRDVTRMAHSGRCSAMPNLSVGPEGAVRVVVIATCFFSGQTSDEEIEKVFRDIKHGVRKIFHKTLTDGISTLAKMDAEKDPGSTASEEVTREMASDMDSPEGITAALDAVRQVVDKDLGGDVEMRMDGETIGKASVPPQRSSRHEVRENSYEIIADSVGKMRGEGVTATNEKKAIKYKCKAADSCVLKFASTFGEAVEIVGSEIINREYGRVIVGDLSASDVNLLDFRKYENFHKIIAAKLLEEPMSVSMIVDALRECQF